jgi:hypothetical protein
MAAADTAEAPATGAGTAATNVSMPFTTHPL